MNKINIGKIIKYKNFFMIFILSTKSKGVTKLFRL